MRRLAEEAEYERAVWTEEKNDIVLDEVQSQPLSTLFALKGWPCPAFFPIADHKLPANINEFFSGPCSMTSRLEAIFGAPIVIEVVAVEHREKSYRRLVLLKKAGHDAPLLLGGIDIHLDRFEHPVRHEIEKAQQPFGKILQEMVVEHGFHAYSFFSFDAGADLGNLLAIEKSRKLYGRTKLVLGTEDRVLATVTEIPARFRLEAGPVRT